MAGMTNQASKVIVLEVDLSTGNVEKRDLGTELREKYLGSRGINTRFLYDRVGPETDALSPDNILLFGVGPIAGTGIPGGSRVSIQAKSPKYVFGCSNSGGYLPSDLRRAGYDHLIIRGKAEEPVFVWIDNDKVEIRSAAHLWGKGTFETDRLIREELGGKRVSIATIGQAGENLIDMSVIVFDKIRTGASRMGGVVMGSKNLKAVVVRGSGRVDVANKKLVQDLSLKLVEKIKGTSMYQSRSRFGGGHTQALMVQLGAAPIRNMTTNELPEIAGIDRDEIAKYYTKSNQGCPGCPMHRHFSWEIKEGPHAGEKGVGLEGATISAFGGLVGNTYAPAVYKASNLANDYGLDILETSMVIAAAMEWLQKGIITRDDVDGMDLRFGNHVAMIEMIHKIANKQGVGALFAEGPVTAAKKIGNGAEDCITYGKERISGWMDWRSLKGGYLNEVTSSLACEMMDGWSGGQECLRTMSGGNVPQPIADATLKQFGTLDPLDPLSYNKAASVIASQDFIMAMNAVGVCVFCSTWAFCTMGLKDAAELYQAVTGIDMNEEGLLKAATRIRDIERAYWVREGYSRKDDHLKGRLVNEPAVDGPFKGEILDPVECDKMLDQYYELRGWDVQTGIPTREKLLADGLEDVAAELEKMGKL